MPVAKAASWHQPPHAPTPNPTSPPPHPTPNPLPTPSPADNRYARFLKGYQQCVQVLLEGGADPLLRADATGPVTVLMSHPRDDLWEAVLRRRLPWLLPCHAAGSGGAGPEQQDSAVASEREASPADCRPGAATVAAARRWLAGLTVGQASDLLCAAAAVGEPEQASELVRLAAPLSPAQAEGMLRALAAWHCYDLSSPQVGQGDRAHIRCARTAWTAGLQHGDCLPAVAAWVMRVQCRVSRQLPAIRMPLMLAPTQPARKGMPMSPALANPPIPPIQLQLVCDILDACKPSLFASMLASADMAQQGLGDLLWGAAEVPHLGAVQRLLAMGAPLSWDTLLTAVRRAACKRRSEDTPAHQARPSRFVPLMAHGEAGPAGAADEEAAPVQDEHGGAAERPAAAGPVPAGTGAAWPGPGRDPPDARAALEVLQALLQGAAALPQPELGTPEAAVELEGDSCIFAWLATQRTEVSAGLCEGCMVVVFRQASSAHALQGLSRSGARHCCVKLRSPALSPWPCHLPAALAASRHCLPCSPAFHASRAAPRTGRLCTASGAWWRQWSCCWVLVTSRPGWPGPGTCQTGHMSRCCCGITHRLMRRWRKRAPSWQGGFGPTVLALRHWECCRGLEQGVCLLHLPRMLGQSMPAGMARSREFVHDCTTRGHPEVLEPPPARPHRMLCMTVDRPPWSLASHCQFPPAFREAARAVLLAARRRQRMSHAAALASASLSEPASCSSVASVTAAPDWLADLPGNALLVAIGLVAYPLSQWL